MKFIKKQPFIDYCWRFGFDWSLRRNGLSNQRTAIRQTVPTKASVEAETSTINNQ